MRSSATRRIAAVVLAAGLVLSAFVVPATAKPGHGRGPKVVKVAKAQNSKAQAARAKAAAKKATKVNRGKSAAAKARKAAKLNAAGTVVSAGAGELTLTVKGSNVKGLKGRDLTVLVPVDARVRLDGVAATVDDLAAGDTVAVQGVRQSDGSYRVARVNASRPEPVEEPTDEPTEPGDEDEIQE